MPPHKQHQQQPKLGRVPHFEHKKVKIFLWVIVPLNPLKWSNFDDCVCTMLRKRSSQCSSKKKLGSEAHLFNINGGVVVEVLMQDAFQYFARTSQRKFHHPRKTLLGSSFFNTKQHSYMHIEISKKYDSEKKLSFCAKYQLFQHPQFNS